MREEVGDWLGVAVGVRRFIVSAFFEKALEALLASSGSRFHLLIPVFSVKNPVLDALWEVRGDNGVRPLD